MCTLVQVCVAVHAGAHKELFCIDPLMHPATRKTNSKRIRKREIAKSRFGIFENRDRRKAKMLRANLEPIALQQAASCHNHRQSCKLALHLSPLPDAQPQECTATKHTFNLNSAPNEATTSIRLKVMMVCRDLRGNIEPSEMESGTEGEIGSPRGGAPRGESGLILVAERSASALYLRGNLHVSGGIQLGDTVSPSVTPCVSPRCRRPMADKAPHVGTSCRVWIPDVVVSEWGPAP